MMAIRRWAYLSLAVTVFSLYCVMFNLLNPQGMYVYLMAIIGVVLMVYLTVRVYLAGDKQQIYLKLKHLSDTSVSVYRDMSRTIIAEEKSSGFNLWSQITSETYDVATLRRLIGVFDLWKRLNNFEWNADTVYDVLAVEAVADKTPDGVTYVIHHQVYTKKLTITGELMKDTSVADDNAYLINGLRFYLSNVSPDNLNQVATWELSIDVNGPLHTGMITDIKGCL